MPRAFLIRKKREKEAARAASLLVQGNRQQEPFQEEPLPLLCKKSTNPPASAGKQKM